MLSRFCLVLLSGSLLVVSIVVDSGKTIDVYTKLIETAKEKLYFEVKEQVVISLFLLFLRHKYLPW